MNEQQLSALRIWHETVTESEKEIDALVEIGFAPESRLCTAINNALEAITQKSAARLHRVRWTDGLERTLKRRTI